MLYSVSVIVIIGSIFVSHASAQNYPNKNRSDYIDGGAYDFSWNLGPERLKDQWPIVREFIWNNWKEKRAAKLVITLYSIEGDPTINHIFIESDKAGKWIIVREYESYCCWFFAFEKKKRMKKRIRGRKVYDVLELLEQNRGRDVFKAGNDTPDFSGCMLRLKINGEKTSSENEIIL